MEKQDDAVHTDYPIGRGYGHDYMRGGEVLGGYGYSARAEYEQPIGEREHGGKRDTSEQRGDAESG